MQTAAATSNFCHLGADIAVQFGITNMGLNLAKLCDANKVVLSFFSYILVYKEKHTETNPSNFRSVAAAVFPASFSGVTGFESQSEDWQS